VPTVRPVANEGAGALQQPTTGTVEIEKDGGVWVVTLRGEHDRYTARRLRDALESIFALGVGPVTQQTAIVVDLTDVDFMDSSLISALVLARSVAKRDPRAALAVATRSPPAVADRVFTLSGTARVIPTYPTRVAAVAALTRPSAAEPSAG
jgi:anti-anti-sigma factor